MSLHGDLLEQARHLARRESKRPKQASLRRAISTAYYALFHLLIFEASRLFARDDRLWKRMNRVYTHAKMRAISMEFSKGQLPRAFNAVQSLFSIPPELRNVAKAFVDLQQARHNADYNLTVSFTRSDVFDFVEQIEEAFADWETVRQDDLARIYLGCFLLWDEWDKTR